MALKLSEVVRNARLDQIETTIGQTAVLKIRTLAPPASITDADVGAELAVLTLPADWMNPALSGSKTKLGNWSVSASLPGVAGHFRIYASDGTTQHIQGTVTLTGVGGDMELDNTNIAAGQTVTITTFTLTDGNA